MGYTSPTPIQEQAIPLLRAGHDVLGQAQTGTGKTAGFGIPLIEGIDPQQRAVQAIVLVPTRELCLQVADELARLGRYGGVRVLAVYGGVGMGRQLEALARGVHIVVGTPGRVEDHLQRGTLSLERVRLAILDEADRMLDVGFLPAIEAILRRTQNQRERVLADLKAGNLQALVATDIAARGLDIAGLTHVFNYDLPDTPETYVHRIGRTGRAGESGAAITLVAPEDEEGRREIERYLARRASGTTATQRAAPRPAAHLERGGRPAEQRQTRPRQGHGRGRATAPAPGRRSDVSPPAPAPGRRADTPAPAPAAPSSRRNRRRRRSHAGPRPAEATAR